MFSGGLGQFVVSTNTRYRLQVGYTTNKKGLPDGKSLILLVPKRGVEPPTSHYECKFDCRFKRTSFDVKREIIVHRHENKQ